MIKSRILAETNVYFGEDRTTYETRTPEGKTLTVEAPPLTQDEFWPFIRTVRGLEVREHGAPSTLTVWSDTDPPPGKDAWGRARVTLWRAPEPSEVIADLNAEQERIIEEIDKLSTRLRRVTKAQGLYVTGPPDFYKKEDQRTCSRGLLMAELLMLCTHENRGWEESLPAQFAEWLGESPGVVRYLEERFDY